MGQAAAPTGKNWVRGWAVMQHLSALRKGKTGDYARQDPSTTDMNEMWVCEWAWWKNWGNSPTRLYLPLVNTGVGI